MPPLSLPVPASRPVVVVGGGWLGTATAVVLARGGLRTTLHGRAAGRLERDRENREYLPGGLSRADSPFLGA